MPESDVQHLRILIANERRDRLELLAQVVIGLGHDLIAREMLRDHSQHNGRKLADIATAIVESHLLLLPPPAAAATYDGPSTDGARAPALRHERPYEAERD